MKIHMVLLNLSISISFRAMYGLILLEISFLDRFFFRLHLMVQTTTDNYRNTTSSNIRKRLKWEYLKILVYDIPVAPVKILRNNIIAACEKI